MPLTREELETGGVKQSQRTGSKGRVKPNLESDPRDQISTAMPTVHARARALSVAPKVGKSLGLQLAEALEGVSPGLTKLNRQIKDRQFTDGERAAIAGEHRNSEATEAYLKGFDDFTGKRLAVDVDSRVSQRLEEDPNASFGKVFREEFDRSFGKDVAGVSEAVRNSAADFLGRSTPARIAAHDRAQFEKRRKAEFFEISSTLGRQLAAARDGQFATDSYVTSQDHEFQAHAADRGFDQDLITKSRIDIASQHALESKDPDFLIRHFSQKDPGNGIKLINSVYGDSIRDRAREIGRLVDHEDAQVKANRLWATELTFRPAVLDGTFNTTMGTDAVSKGIERGTVRGWLKQSLKNRETIETLNGDMAAMSAGNGFQVPTQKRRDAAMEGLMKQNEHMLRSDDPGTVDAFIDGVVELGVKNNAIHSEVRRMLDQGAVAGGGNKKVFQQGFSLFLRMLQSNPEYTRKSMEKSSFESYSNFNDLLMMGLDANSAIENLTTVQERLPDVRLSTEEFVDTFDNGFQALKAHKRAKLLIAAGAPEDEAIAAAIARSKGDFKTLSDGEGMVPTRALPPRWDEDTDEFMLETYLPEYLKRQGDPRSPDEFIVSGTEHSERDGTLAIYHVETGLRAYDNIPSESIHASQQNHKLAERKEAREEARAQLRKRETERARMWAAKRWVNAIDPEADGRIPNMPNDYLGGPDQWAAGLREERLQENKGMRFDEADLFGALGG
jgi:hypothetical protein